MYLSNFNMWARLCLICLNDCRNLNIQIEITWDKLLIYQSSKKRGTANLHSQNTGNFYIEGAAFKYHSRSG